MKSRVLWFSLIVVAILLWTVTLSIRPLYGDLAALAALDSKAPREKNWVTCSAKGRVGFNRGSMGGTFINRHDAVQKSLAKDPTKAAVAPYVDMRDPDAPALIDASDFDNPVELSHGELNLRANAVARALVARGYKRGDRIAILAANSADYLVTYLGAMRAGMISVPVNWRFPPETIAYILDDCDAKIVFADAIRRDAVPVGLPVIEFGADFQAFLNPGPFEVVSCGQDEVAVTPELGGGMFEGTPLLRHSGRHDLAIPLELSSGMLQCPATLCHGCQHEFAVIHDLRSGIFESTAIGTS